MRRKKESKVLFRFETIPRRDLLNRDGEPEPPFVSAAAVERIEPREPKLDGVLPEMSSAPAEVKVVDYVN